MYKSKVFLVGKDKQELVALEETGYVNETDLQELLARYPDLIPGDQIDPENPRRWLLVAREMGVPGDTDETGRWSLDHLFLDQEGIPTFVECKRATDTRGRREVVAQMLDYAANGVEYWDIDRIVQSAAETAQREGKTLDDKVIALLGAEAEAGALPMYWDSVAANLKNRRVRLVFVSDSTPRELRRLVEFLNEEMANVEVLAVEVKQYQGSDNQQHRALVPRVIGFTEAARAAKGTGAGPRGTTNLDDVVAGSTTEAGELFRRVAESAAKRQHTLYWGRVGFSVRAPIAENGGLASFIYGFPPDRLQFYFDDKVPMFSDPATSPRSDVEASGAFTSGGSYTLTAEVSAVGVAKLIALCERVMDRVDDIARARKASG